MITRNFSVPNPMNEYASQDDTNALLANKSGSADDDSPFLPIGSADGQSNLENPILDGNNTPYSLNNLLGESDSTGINNSI